MILSAMLMLCLSLGPAFASMDSGDLETIENAAAAGDVETMTIAIQTAVENAVAVGTDPADAVEEALKTATASAVKAGLHLVTLGSVMYAASFSAILAAGQVADESGVAFDADAVVAAATRGALSGASEAAREMGITMEPALLEALAAAAGGGSQMGLQLLLETLPSEPEAYEEPGESDMPAADLTPPPAPVVETPPAQDELASPI
jgi:hypothetical protein